MIGLEGIDQMELLHGLEDGTGEGMDDGMGDGMDDGMGDGLDEEEMDLEDSKPITEEDAWTVIAAHFQEKGLVSQQLESYDGFITSTLQVRY